MRERDLLKKFLSYFRFYLLKNEREKNLANIYYKIIKNNKKKISICDYGSGFNPDIIRFLAKKINSKNIDCFDFYTNKELNLLNNNTYNIKFKKIKNFKNSKKKYDIIILSDVLHHIGIKNKIIKKILLSLQKKSRILIIKDHFEHSMFDRLLLQIMDFIGNYKDNVNIPNQYFTKESFEEILINANLKKYKIIPNLKVYSKKFLFFSKTNLHFLCIVK